MAIKRTLLFLYLMNLLLGLLYLSFIPPWQAPDENHHFEYVMLLDELHRPVNRDDSWNLSEDGAQRLLDSLSQYHYFQLLNLAIPDGKGTALQQLDRSVAFVYSELHQPPLYYLLCWPVYKVVALLGGGIDQQLYALRFLGILLAGLTPLLAFGTARLLFPAQRWLPVAVALLITGIPMHAAIAASVNNDILIEVESAAAIFLFAYYLRFGGLKPLLAEVVLIALMLETKRTGAFLLPLFAVAVILAAWVPGRRRWVAGMIVAAVCLAAAFIFAYNAPQSSLPTSLPEVAQLDADPGFRDHVLKGYFLQPEILQQYMKPQGIPLMFESFWAVFGWFSIHLNPLYIQALLLLTSVAFSGLLLGVWRDLFIRHDLLAIKGVLLCGSAVVLTMTIALLRANPTPTQINIPPQGRYLFVALIPIGILLARGFGELLPSRRRAFTGIWLAISLTLFNAICLIWYIIPFYYLR